MNRAVETWIDLKDFQPGKTKVVEIEELLDLNNGVLFQSLNKQIESNHYNILSDLAAASFNGTQSDNEDEGTSHVEDDGDDSPRNCVLYGQGKCLYLTKNYRRPKETSWIGCEFPNCNDWCKRQGFLHFCL